MTSSTKAPKNAVVIKAPKIASAWLKVVSTANNSEVEVIKAIENLSAVMVLESRLSVRDIKKVIASTGKACGLVSVSHVEALPTWSKLRALHADFKALPLAKQLSTASASYSLLGAGKGEQFKTFKALESEVKTVRKNKQTPKTTPAKSAKVAKASNLDAIKAFTALVSSLDFANLSDAEAEAFAMLQTVIEDKALIQA